MKKLFVLGILFSCSNILTFGLGLDTKRDQSKAPYSDAEIASATRGGVILSKKLKTETFQMVCTDPASTDLSNCEEFRFATVDRGKTSYVYVDYRKYTRADLADWKSFKRKLKSEKIERDLGVTKKHLEMNSAITAATRVDLLGFSTGDYVFGIAMALPLAPFAAVTFVGGTVYDILMLPEGLVIKAKMNRYLRSIVNNDPTVKLKLGKYFQSAKDEL